MVLSIATGLVNSITAHGLISDFISDTSNSAKGIERNIHGRSVHAKVASGLRSGLKIVHFHSLKKFFSLLWGSMWLN